MLPEPSGFGRLDPAPPIGLTAEQLIAKFGARETEFAKARDQYIFRQTVKIETIGEDTGRPNGAYNQTTDITFGDDNKRAEHVVFAPGDTLKDVILSQSDFEDIAHRLPFVLTTADLPEYDVTYLGRQRVDEIDTYVFRAGPKRIEKNKRYFQGKVWIDQKDFEIVLVNGKNVPDDVRRGHEDLSPPFMTYYQEIDGKNWFPVYTHGDGILHFSAQDGALGQDVHLRYTVKYTDYKRFRAKSRLIYNGEEIPGADPNAAPGAEPGAVPAPAATPPAEKRKK